MSDIFKDLLFKIVDNPINALSSGNYLGILTWAIAGGIALKHCSNEAKQVFIDIIKKTTNNEQNPIIELISLITKTAEANTSNDPFDFVLNLIKMKNDNGSGEYILKEILTQLIPNQTILTIIDQILFDNPHLTKENFISFIDVFANPRKTKDKNGEIVNLKT